MDKETNFDLLQRVQSLEERVKYLESLIMNQSQCQSHSQSIQTKPYDFDEIRESITVNDSHLDQILKTNMEEQIIAMIVEENQKRPFIKMMKDTKWNLSPEISKIFLIDMFKNNKELFKNTGGSIETFITKLKMCHSKRVFPLDKQFKFIITKEDIDESIKEVKKHSDIKEKLILSYYT